MSADPIHPRGGGPIRSRVVRRILRLDRQAARQTIRFDQAQARADRIGRRVTDLRCTAEALQQSLTGSQRAELARARAADAEAATAPDPDPIPEGR
jgi:hypothetical protein